MIWIRTQDKEALVEVKELSIEDYECISIVADNYLRLGVYSTKEKAIEVLNRIQAFINSRHKRIIVNHYYEQFHSINDVYEMPQDDEVKV